MHLCKTVAPVLSVFFAGCLFAQAADIAKPAIPAPGLKLTRITGTVHLMKYGLVVITLRPGDAIPSLADPNITFAVVDGSIELKAGREKISAEGGANFTLTAEKGREVLISVDEGSPLEFAGVYGGNVLLAQNSEVRINYTLKKTKLYVKKGNAMVTMPGAKEPNSVNAGETVEIPVILPINTGTDLTERQVADVLGLSWYNQTER